MILAHPMFLFLLHRRCRPLFRFSITDSRLMILMFLLQILPSIYFLLVFDQGGLCYYVHLPLTTPHLEALTMLWHLLLVYHPSHDVYLHSVSVDSVSLATGTPLVEPRHQLVSIVSRNLLATTTRLITKTIMMMFLIIDPIRDPS